MHMRQDVLYYNLLLVSLLFFFFKKKCVEEQEKKRNVQYVSLRLLYFSWIYVV